MKLLRHGAKGAEKPALLDAQGQVRDLSKVLPDITASTLSPTSLQRLREIKIDTLPIVATPGRLAPPWSGMHKFICVGLNYADHAAESGMAVPAEPVLFTKATSALIGCNDAVVLPQGSVKSDWEVELGVVIGTKARYVSEADALKFVAGYCVVNDLSEREYQLERGGTWDKGKGCDTFGPVGPWMVTAVDVARCQRPTHAERQHPHDGVRGGSPRELHQPLHDPAARRHHQHRHAAGGGHGQEARADLPQGGRRDPPRHRRPR
jgi:2-keto-4-pentenoate hydratase/2-oxohepta-3-ene-1,7-dioic acid hydratase in catechol pathway